jgi:hypothetical protein
MEEETRVRTVERRGALRVPSTRRWPRVIGGICEFCGVIEPKLPSTDQYKLCKHYKGMELRCTYCDETKDPTEVVGHHRLNVAEHPEHPEKLVVWCGDYKCRQAHEKRFKLA